MPTVETRQALPTLPAGASDSRRALADALLKSSHNLGGNTRGNSLAWLGAVAQNLSGSFLKGMNENAANNRRKALAEALTRAMIQDSQPERPRMVSPAARPSAPSPGKPVQTPSQGRSRASDEGPIIRDLPDSPADSAPKTPDVSFDDLIPKRSAGQETPDVTFDDLIPKKDEGQEAATPETPDITFDDLIPERPGIGEGLARSVGQGVTFGFGDEIEAAFRSLFGEETYREAVDDVRREIDAFREDNPALAYGSEIASSLLLPGGAAMKAMRYAPTVGRAALRGAQIAGASGAVAGAGQAEGNENIVPGMIRGGATGAVTGAAVPFAVPALAATGRTAWKYSPARWTIRGGKLVLDALRKRAAPAVAQSAQLGATGSRPVGFLATDFLSDQAERAVRQAAAKRARRDLAQRIRDTAIASGIAQQGAGQQ